MATLSEEQFEALQLLLKAPSKDAVWQISKDSFRTGAAKQQSVVDKTAEILSVSSNEAVQLLTAFHALSHHVVYYNLTSPEEILSLFPESFHSNLRSLITKILLENSAAWRNEAVSNQISLPKLVDLEWRVDMKTASDSLSRLAVPTCLLQMKLQDSSCNTGGHSEPSVTMELSKETLDTMIDGLGRIREQLTTMYCTAGAGMETLLADELQQKLHAVQVDHFPGRVFFSSNAKLHNIIQLKSAERLFLLLQRADPISLPNNPAQAAAVIKQRVMGDPETWKQTFSTWTGLQKELNSQKKRKREEEESVIVDDVLTKPFSSNTHVEMRDCEIGKESQHRSPSFRVSCRCSGVIARSYSSQVNVYINDDHCVVGFPLLKNPLACRSYMKHNGLRSTVAWAMSSLCPKQDGVVLDPMCGVGAVLLEAAQEYSNAVFLGMDTDESQLQKAAENVKASGMEGRVQLLKSSAMAIPLGNGTVDALLCDVPFGRKFCCGSDMSSALPLLLREMERVLRVGGHLVLLLSLQLSAQMRKVICTQKQEQTSESLGKNIELSNASNTLKECSETFKPILISSLQIQRTHKVSLGSTDAFIHTYIKIQTPTCNDQSA
ncbi:hypothetical protein DNTS_027318 [Danionella cerebrum]|uniref:COMM domain-containing protein n=1 Tax=Danionella cerebrum TaxID=2873325 RepID=A0A553QVU2_9TELE|nr:hypothetical protein DNTS_027318 [Danionella translucida]